MLLSDSDKSFVNDVLEAMNKKGDIIHSESIFIELNQDDTHIIASKLLLIGIFTQHNV